MIHRVRAIILKNNQLLTIKRVKTDITYFVFPGGGVETREELREAMKRECKEELGVEVRVIDEFTSERFDQGEIKQLEHFYICEIVSGELGTGDGPEYDDNSDYEGTHEIEWLNISDLGNYDLRPTEVVVKLINYLKNDKKFKN
jgi:8-oxo-dGTP pyrophosphatase MutT (NUDIX family)